ncbi:MAG: hypothetical protein ABW143_13605 [Acidimicrobiales bacterium]
MRDVLVVIGLIAFFSLGAAYIAACARILTSTGDIDEPLDEGDGEEEAEAEPSDAGELVQQ